MAQKIISKFEELYKTPRIPKLYHYTSHEALLSIIESKALWATGIRHLNDATELLYSYEFLQKLIGSARKDVSDSAGEDGRFLDALLYALSSINLNYELSFKSRFLVSFSAKGDLLSQWRAYSPAGAGYSLCFDGPHLKKLADTQDFRLVKCIYDEDEQEKELSKIVESAKESYKDASDEIFPWLENWRSDPDEPDEFLEIVNKVWHELLTVAPTLKDPAFGEEREWRLVSDYINTREKTSSICYRPGKNCIIPYINFELESTDSVVRLDNLNVGPTPDPELTRMTTENFLKQNKVAFEKINISRIPYREW